VQSGPSKGLTALDSPCACTRSEIRAWESAHDEFFDHTSNGAIAGSLTVGSNATKLAIDCRPSSQIRTNAGFQFEVVFAPQTLPDQVFGTDN
jgi:hypothetical protein